MCLSALHKYYMDFAQITQSKIRSKEILTCALFLSLSYKQKHYTHAHTTAADPNSPFLPEFGGPGGLSVTDPVKGNKNMYTAKTRQQQQLS